MEWWSGGILRSKKAENGKTEKREEDIEELGARSWELGVGRS
jgi:hypothetical protein